jgi:hypothetical protein
MCAPAETIRECKARKQPGDRGDQDALTQATYEPLDEEFSGRWS